MYCHQPLKIISYLFSSILLSQNVTCFKLKSYHFNKYSTSNFEKDCMHTTRTNITIPTSFTFCYRHKPVITFNEPWSNVFLGNMNEDWSDAARGFYFSIWSYGPWGAALNNGSTVWVSYGTNVDFGLLAWRHTCFTINFDTGHSSLYENGKLQFEDEFDEIVQFKETMPFAPKTVSIGCHYGQQIYRTERAQIVTDFQLYSRVLSSKEMKDWTSCKKRYPGDIINWEVEDWYFNKTETPDVSEIEELEFEKDICDVTGKSEHIFPVETSIQKALQLCKKFSGELFM